MRELAFAYLAGARPNFVKLAPVLAALRERVPEAEHVLIHTGQHYDHEMSRDLHRRARPSQPGLFPRRRLGPARSSDCAGRSSGSKRCWSSGGLAALIVPGDVNSTLAGALAAAKLEIPVAHIESGLRSFDRTMPEEINRIAGRPAVAVVLHAQPGSRGEPAARGDRPRPGVLRREHDDRHAGTHAPPRSRLGHPSPSRHRARRVRPRNAAPAEARGRPAAGPTCRRASEREPSSPGRVSRAPAPARAESSCATTRACSCSSRSATSTSSRSRRARRP